MAMLYCLLFGLGKGTAVTSLITALGLILWCGILLMESYFDVSVQMNAPAKLALHLGCIGGMLLMIGELRLVCGHAKPRLYAFSVSSATLFLGMASIPSVIADAFLRLPARDHALSDLVFFGLFLLGLSRLIVPGKAEPTAEEETETPVETSETPESPDDAEPQTESDETPAEPSQSKETT